MKIKNSSLSGSLGSLCSPMRLKKKISIPVLCVFLANSVMPAGYALDEFSFLPQSDPPALAIDHADSSASVGSAAPASGFLGPTDQFLTDTASVLLPPDPGLNEETFSSAVSLSSGTAGGEAGESGDLAGPLSGSAGLPPENAFLTRTGTGIYEMELDGYFKALMDELLSPDLTGGFDPIDLVNVELAALQQRLHEGFAGLYDFVVLVPTEAARRSLVNFNAVAPDGIQGFGAAQKDDIDGIGFIQDDPLVSDLNRVFGPAFEELFSPFSSALKYFGSLQGSAWVDFTNIAAGGLTSLGAKAFVTIHEIAHRWGIFLSTGGVKGSNPLGILREDAHWGAFFDAGFSPMDGLDWRDNGDGTFTLQRIYGMAFDDFVRFQTGQLTDPSQISRFNDFELYAMGLLDPADASPSFVIDQPRTLSGTALTEENFYRTVFSDPAFVFGSPTIRGVRQDVTLEDIIAIEGPRNPGAAGQNAQKDFSVAFVMLKDLGESGAGIQSVRSGLQALGGFISSAWSSATQGLSTLTLGPSAGAFDAFKDTVLDVYDMFVGVLKTGLYGGQTPSGPEREADLNAAEIRAAANRDALRDFTALVEEAETALVPWAAKAQGSALLRGVIGGLTAALGEAVTELEDFHAGFEDVLAQADDPEAEIARTRLALAGWVESSRDDGILPVGFGRTAEGMIDGIDAFYESVTGLLNHVSTVFETRKNGMESLLRGIPDYLQAMQVRAALFDPSILISVEGRSAVSGKGLSASGGVPGFFSIREDGPEGFRSTYELSHGEDAFVVFSKTFEIPVPGQAGLTIAMKGPAGAMVKVEAEDEAGRTAVFLIESLGEWFNYPLDFSGASAPVGFDAAAIKKLNFSIDRVLAGPANYRGDLEFRFRPANPDGPYRILDFDRDQLTSFPSRPLIRNETMSLTGGVPGFERFMDESANEYGFIYDLRHGQGAAVRNVMEFQSPADFSSGLTFALQGPSGSGAILEITDEAGRTVSLNLDFSGTFRNYQFDWTQLELPEGFALARIKSLSLFLSRSTVRPESYRDTVRVTFGELPLPVLEGTVYDPMSLTPFPGTPGLSAAGWSETGGVPGYVTLSNDPPAGHHFVYDLRHGQAAAVSNTLDFGDGIGLAGDFTMALNGPEGGRARVEFIDEAGKKAVFLVRFSGDLRNYIFDLSAAGSPYGFNPGAIGRIEIILDRSLMNPAGYRGTVEVRYEKSGSVPVIEGAEYDSLAHTGFTALRVSADGLSGTGGVPGYITMTAVNPVSYGFVYDLRHGQAAEVRSRILFETGTHLGTRVTFGLRGPAGARIRVEVKDGGGKSIMLLLNLTGDFQNYTLDLAGDFIPEGFDLSDVRSIDFWLTRELTGPLHYRGAVDFLFRRLELF